MKRPSTKATAEAVLRELPSVLGAYVNEDLEGSPREVHILIREGPDPATLARDIRGLLEERLGQPIDQRVISIAQLAGGPEDDAPADEGPDHVAGEAVAGPAAGRSTLADQRALTESRPVFAGLESTVTSGHLTIGVRLDWQGRTAEGTAEAADTAAGRARAAAAATLEAATDAAAGDDLKFELDFASIVQALDDRYVLISVLAMSRRLGRRPLSLVGAQPVESDVESAAVFATLKAINRVLSPALDPD